MWYHQPRPPAIVQPRHVQHRLAFVSKTMAGVCPPSYLRVFNALACISRSTPNNMLFKKIKIWYNTSLPSYTVLSFVSSSILCWRTNQKIFMVLYCLFSLSNTVMDRVATSLYAKSTQCDKLFKCPKGRQSSASQSWKCPVNANKDLGMVFGLMFDSSDDSRAALETTTYLPFLAMISIEGGFLNGLRSAS